MNEATLCVSLILITAGCSTATVSEVDKSTEQANINIGGSWVYIIDPRAKNFVDDLKTLPDPKRQRDLEKAVVAIDGIDADDILCWRLKTTTKTNEKVLRKNCNLQSHIFR